MQGGTRACLPMQGGARVHSCVSCLMPCVIWLSSCNVGAEARDISAQSWAQAATHLPCLTLCRCGHIEQALVQSRVLIEENALHAGCVELCMLLRRVGTQYDLA